MTMSTYVLKLRWPAAVAAAIGLIGAGVGIAVFWRPAPQTVASVAPPAPATASAPSAEALRRGEPVAVTIPQDVAARAGIEVATVISMTESGDLTVPGVVEPHGYKHVVVTPLAAGRVTRVLVELGQQVTRGQTMAEIYSPELASAQTAFLSARAELEATRARLKRNERLVEIGAASRQELEVARADEARLATELASARSRLVLLGMSPARVEQLTTAQQMTSAITVPAPIAGVVTTRAANVGLNVDQSTTLFTVVDLSTVWVVGDVSERDLAKVRVGTAATVRTDAFAGLSLTGRVSYIDPQVNETTRTAKVRVEVANRDRVLRLGMFATLTLTAAGSRTVAAIPADALQTMGDRTVVYVVDPNQQGRFIERRVTSGTRVGDTLQILSGLKEGEVVAARGSFFIRAERERINPSTTAGADQSMAPGPAVGTPPSAAITVEVTERGFEPPRVTVPRGERATITFVRRTDNTCAKEVVIESQRIRRELPLNQPVTIEIPASSTGEITFVCGMNMLKGAVVVQ